MRLKCPVYNQLYTMQKNLNIKVYTTLELSWNFKNLNKQPGKIDTIWIKKPLLLMIQYTMRILIGNSWN